MGWDGKLGSNPRHCSYNLVADLLRPFLQPRWRNQMETANLRWESFRQMLAPYLHSYCFLTSRLTKISRFQVLRMFFGSSTINLNICLPIPILIVPLIFSVWTHFDKKESGNGKDRLKKKKKRFLTWKCQKGFLVRSKCLGAPGCENKENHSQEIMKHNFNYLEIIRRIICKKLWNTNSITWK